MTITALVEKTCTPCRGGIPPLTVEEVSVIHKQVPEWTIHDDSRRIERTYTFKNFAQAFSLVHKVAELAEAEGHHPDISFGWGYATMSLQTEKIKGLHENDFITGGTQDMDRTNLPEPARAAFS